MRAVYTISIDEKPRIKKPGIKLSETQTIPLAHNIKIKLYNDQKTGYLQRILIEISNLEVDAVAPYLEGLADTSSSRELESIAHKLTVYLANVLFKQTSIEVFDHNKIDLEYPEVLPETPEEEEILARHRPMRSGTLNTSWRILRSIEPEKIREYFANAVAVNHYAEAQKTGNPFRKYEQFYKVIEYFFDKEQPKQKSCGQQPDSFVKRVSRYACTYDEQYTEDVIKNIREIRNRVVHPRARKGHLAPGDLTANKSITEYLLKIEKLAELLLDHPPHDRPNEEQPSDDL